MKWLHLGYEYFACVDDNDFETAKTYIWRYHPKMYARTHQILGDGKDVFLHDFLLPEKDLGQEIDHLNRATWDNRRCNLRICEQWENQQNKGIPLNAPFPSLKEMEEAISLREKLKASQNYLSIAAKKNQNWKKREAKRVNRKVSDSQGNVFLSSVEAAKYYGAKGGSNVLACCKGKKKTAYGQSWAFAD